MAGRTYRYFSGEPLYPFGYGLSFTHFQYRNLQVGTAPIRAKENLQVNVEVKNSGTVAGDEVVQLYLTHLNAPVPVPIRSLAGFNRVHLKPGESKAVSFNLAPRQISVIDNNGRRVVMPGKIKIEVGGKQPGFHGRADASTTEALSTEIDVSGQTPPVE